MIVKLTRQQFVYLSEMLLRYRNDLNSKLSVQVLANHFLIETDAETSNEIRDWACDELQRYGFDLDYNLNNQGRILESLVDAFLVDEEKDAIQPGN